MRKIFEALGDLALTFFYLVAAVILVLALAGFSPSVRAMPVESAAIAVAGVMENNGNGSITLYNERGLCKTGLRVRATVKNIPDFEFNGCWLRPRAAAIYIYWEDGDTLVYPAEGFVGLEAFK
jgi:hypothetical protein